MTEFRILGPLEVVADGGSPVELGGQRQRVLLALLLLHANEVVSTDRLVDELWGEQPPRTAMASLQNRVSQLRKLLGAGRPRDPPAGLSAPRRAGAARPRALRAPRRARRARPPAERAQALREALALWRGEPLADLAFEAFAQGDPPARRAPARGARGPDRGRPRAGGARRGRRRARGARRAAPAARAAPRAADARPLPLRPPGGGAPGLPRRAPAPRRGARASIRGRSCSGCTAILRQERARDPAARAAPTTSSPTSSRRCSPRGSCPCSCRTASAGGPAPDRGRRSRRTSPTRLRLPAGAGAHALRASPSTRR